MANEQIEALSFSIDINTSKAVQAIDKLSSSLEKFESAANAFTTSGVGKAITEMGQAVANMDENKVKSFGRALASLGKANDKVGNLGATASGLRDLVDAIPEDAVSRMERFASAIAGLKGVSITKAASAMKAATKSAPLEQDADLDYTYGMFSNRSDVLGGEAAWASDMSAGIERTSEDLGFLMELLDQLGQYVKIPNIFAGGFDTLADAAKRAAKETLLLPMTIGSKFASQVKSVTSSLAGLVRQFTRIATIKAIRGLISSITKSFQEGVKALYEYSDAMGGRFAASMDSLSTSANYLSNSLAAMASPIYNALAPALDYLVDKIVTVMNMINMLFAALGGAATTTIAKKVPTTFGDASKAIGGTGGAAKGAAKELKRYILAFDEINALGSQNSGGGSGGGGGGAGGIGSLAEMAFEDVAIDSRIRDFVDRIKGFISENNFLGLGDFLGEAFNNAVDSIPWADLGSKLGHGIDAIIKTAYGFLRTANFLDLGANIATFINNAIGSVDWEYLGRLIIRGFTSAVDLFIGFVSNLNTAQLAQGISDFLLGGWNELKEWLNSKDWNEIGDIIGTKIGEFVVNIKWLELVRTAIHLLMDALYDSMSLIGGLIEGFFGALMNKVFKDLFGDKYFLPDKSFDWGQSYSDFDYVDAKDVPKSGGTSSAGSSSAFGSFQKGIFSATFKGMNAGITKVAGVPINKVIDATEEGSYTAAQENFQEGWSNTHALKTVDAQYGSFFRPIAADFRSLISNTATKTAEGIRTGKFITLHDDYVEVKDKNATLTAKGEKTKSFDDTVSAYDKAPSGTKTATVKATADVSSAFFDTVSRVKKAIQGVTGSFVTIFKGGKAMGGVYKNGTWSNIPQYAAGGSISSSHGSMFIAGESGTELVGHINGATEVLNRSQLAATMLSSITAGMLQFVPALTTLDSHVAASAYMSAESNATMMQVLEALVQQNATLSEQNDLLEELLEKDATVEITTASLTAALQRRNQRDGKSIVPVGT